MTSLEILEDAGDNLAAMVTDLLRLWSQAEKALEAGDPIVCASILYQVRREKLNKKLGTAGIVKNIIAELQEIFDHVINPITGGKDAGGEPLSPETEALFERLLPLLQEAFEAVRQAYQDLVENQQALDFDDLEYKAQQLLKKPEICEHWQGELDALLVDEFQDTNHRQNEIIRALAGKPGRLFIVGDSRQSIYRFRKADVTVFREEQARTKREGGSVFELDRTYRAHAPLLETTGELLCGVINAPRDSMPDYYVPYTALKADRATPDEGFRAPHVEFVLGIGEDADSGRSQAARTLAARLLQLKNEEKQIKKWDDVALLFRTSNSYPAYEEAFEDAGIPFVTVAGKGFYERPEIRDLVNILRVLSDPMDDLAFAGLLRSPAFGLTDAALFLLHQNGQPYWTALQGDLQALDDADRSAAIRTREIISSLLPIVDRVPVAEILNQVVNTLNYRALLASVDHKLNDQDSGASGGRLWRNLDKLLEDAQASQQVSVRSFLDMLETLNDAGAREGEAPAEADGSVVLMTIHKSKGLQVPVVVLADAGRGKPTSSENVYLSSALGVTFKLEQEPLLYKLAKVQDKDQDDCEDLRVLYVALTRAKSRLMISAHAKQNEKGEIKLENWAEQLTCAAGIQSDDLLQGKGKPIELSTIAKHGLRIWCTLPEVPIPTIEINKPEKGALPHCDLPPLYLPLDGFEPDVSEEETREPWHVTGQQDSIPGKVLGKIVHKALQRWLFPGDPRLSALLEMEAFNAGLASEKLRRAAVERATELLMRFRQHPVWEEIISAQERYTELPYTYTEKGRLEHRVIDLLYQNTNGWQILDFKTDPILTQLHKEELVRKYAPQVQRYAATAASKLGPPVQASICFLDDQGKVELVEV